MDFSSRDLFERNDQDEGVLSWSMGDFSHTSSSADSGTTLGNSFSLLGSATDRPCDSQQHLLKRATQELNAFVEEELLTQRGFLQAIVDEVHSKEAKMIDQIRDHVADAQSELLDDYARMSHRDVADQLIDATFAANVMRGLVNWIPDDNKYRLAAHCVASIQLALESKRPDDLCIHFQHLLSIYMDVFDARAVLKDKYFAGSVEQMISKDLKGFLAAIMKANINNKETGSSSFTGDSMEWRSQYLLSACLLILDASKRASRAGDQLGFFDIVEVCGAIGALSATVPAVYGLSVVHQGSSRVKENGSPQTYATITSRGFRIDSKSTAVFPPLPPPGFDASRPSYASVLLKVQKQPEPKPRYNLYCVDNMPPPDQITKTLFWRMLTHMKFVDKANLCSVGRRCSDMNCKRSHSYMEVMSFNPLFKRMKCTQREHYKRHDGHERSNCACIHVDTGLTWDWIDTDKKKLCDYMSRCSASSCIKSHSVAEVCWYNPFFRTRECESLEKCPRVKCFYYHDAKEKRRFFHDEDFVGKEHKMLFPERTHQELAMTLQHLLI